MRMSKKIRGYSYRVHYILRRCCIPRYTIVYPQCYALHQPVGDMGPGITTCSTVVEASGNQPASHGQARQGQQRWLAGGQFPSIQIPLCKDDGQSVAPRAFSCSICFACRLHAQAEEIDRSESRRLKRLKFKRNDGRAERRGRIGACQTGERLRWSGRIQGLSSRSMHSSNCS